MINSGTIIWKDHIVGIATNIIWDMGYLEADWQPAQSDERAIFEDLASQLKGKDVIKEPADGIVALLKYDGDSSGPQNVLILLLDKSKIFMRMISDEVAAYVDKRLLPPWQPAGNPSFLETALKKEVSFFHPLNWKKVRAVGARTDRDDVLFEVLNGPSKYAVVHLTGSKERSRKFPVTRFYKDWQDLYTNRILEDHKEWMKN